jgi:hypothetical protein
MFSFAFLSLDIIIILVIFIASVFISFTKGEYILARFLLSFYPATLIFLYIPYVSLNTAMSQVIAYIAIFAGCYFFLKKNFTTGRSYKSSRRFADSVILGLSTVVTIMTIYYHVIPLDTIWKFSLPFSQYLTSIIPFGIWMLVPIIALTFTHKHNA